MVDRGDVGPSSARAKLASATKAHNSRSGTIFLMGNPPLQRERFLAGVRDTRAPPRVPRPCSFHTANRDSSFQESGGMQKIGTCRLYSWPFRPRRDYERAGWLIAAVPAVGYQS